MAIITFGAKSAEQVTAGKKTVTFRKWPKARVKAGEVYDAARMGYPPQKFAIIKVTGVKRIKLKEIDDKLAKKDGASSSTEAKAYWSKQGFRADDALWLVEFELVHQ
ncbi:MAG TPA: ASCH domain-containing protein [Nitrososphaerales archaeon]|nr:ASCH domain-containing protein [Nitrososphaerales archaeon]